MLELVKEIKESTKREKVRAAIATSWRARNDSFACIYGGKKYSLKEIMKFREARRKRLTSKYQNKVVR